MNCYQLQIDPKDKVIEEKEEEDRTLQNVHKADKIHVSHLDTEDDGINLDMFTSPINYEKSTSSKIQNLDRSYFIGLQ